MQKCQYIKGKEKEKKKKLPPLCMKFEIKIQQV